MWSLLLYLLSWWEKNDWVWSFCCAVSSCYCVTRTCVLGGTGLDHSNCRGEVLLRFWGRAAWNNMELKEVRFESWFSWKKVVCFEPYTHVWCRASGNYGLSYQADTDVVWLPWQFISFSFKQFIKKTVRLTTFFFPVFSFLNVYFCRQGIAWIGHILVAAFGSMQF